MFDELGNPKQMYEGGTNKSFNDNNDARDDIFVKSKALNSTSVSLCEVLSIKTPFSLFFISFHRYTNVSASAKCRNAK